MAHQLGLLELYKMISPTGSVLDVGCHGFGQQQLTRMLNLNEIKHFGVDYNEYPETPSNFVFRKADLDHEPIPFDDDSFDLVVATHVIEHLNHSVQLFGECVRVCKPGGFIFVAAPSERSLNLPGMPFAHDSFFSLSFFDDPTHIGRPWSPQSLHRLARYYHCVPLATGYQTFPFLRRLAGIPLMAWAWLRRNGYALERNVWGVVGWTSYLAAQKPLDKKGKPSFFYYIPPR